MIPPPEIPPEIWTATNNPTTTVKALIVPSVFTVQWVIDKILKVNKNVPHISTHHASQTENPPNSLTYKLGGWS